ncbi:hypothetical protein MBLNU13_g11353t1 [Cladosporium sp. NU13]
MHGVLKPVPQSRDAYSQVTPLQGNHSYYGAQYAHPSQSQQSQQSNSRNATLDSPYYPYGTPSAQHGSNGAYATPEQPSSASQTQYSGYVPSTNSYTYPEPAQATPYTPQQAGRSADPISPNQDAGQKNHRATYGLRYQNTVHDLDELMDLLQAEIDAAFKDGVHECVKSELSLGGNAFVPLMRPNIGPYADGGNQDLPADFKKNFTADLVKEQRASQEKDNQADSQTQSQDPSQKDADTSAAQPENGSSEAQAPASPPATQQTSSNPLIPEPEDPLKNCPNATVDCMLNITDTDVRSIIQRAASRGLVQRIMNLDGYKYMFNNFWTSRVDGDGLRFSYTCRDSLQNKDRYAHVPARATTTPPAQRAPDIPVRRTKESWDCKGSISIKFSQTVNAIIIQYRHAAIHPTHASRKRPPRKPAGSRVPGVRGPGRPKGSVGTKRKRDSDVAGVAGAAAALPELLPYAAQYARPAAREPSLFELLQQSAIESAANEDGGQLGDSTKPWWSIT